MSIKKILSFLLVIVSLASSTYIGMKVPASWVIERNVIDVQFDSENQPYFFENNTPTYLDKARPLQNSFLMSPSAQQIMRIGYEFPIKKEIVYEKIATPRGSDIQYSILTAKRHWGWASLIPAITAIALCWLSKDPVTALLVGIISGALLLGKYDITESIIIKEISTPNAASVLVLYLWLLGGLMGIWTKTGAAKAFGEFMTKHFVKGPKTAKLCAWILGIIFFQGGSISTVLVGTTAKPVTDKENISHEELAYIVDSTASPIASQLAFNAWPSYIQSFIYIAGVSWLATEADRVTFFFKSVPFCFYAIFAVLGTFLLSIDKAPFIGSRLKKAIERSRTTGKLDRDGSTPLASPELQNDAVPDYYTPHLIDFILPLFILLGTSIGTFIAFGSPKIKWAFSLALVSAAVVALIRGMSTKDLMDGVHKGLKGVVLGSVILLLAIIIGSINSQTGGGVFLIDMISTSLPYFLLPVCLQLITILIAFSTGTSWGTYAIVFPIAMPLAYAISLSNGLENPVLFMIICFAAVMDGSVYGDQCSPISDTTILTSMSTGCDLMDHVKTQIPQATVAAVIASILWTVTVIVFA